jgi:hypothetical protein
VHIQAIIIGQHHGALLSLPGSVILRMDGRSEYKREE